MKPGKLTNSGVTLIEMMVGMMMSLVIMLAIAMAVTTQSKATTREVKRIDMIHNSQLAGEHVKKLLRAAGYQNLATAGMRLGAITTAGPNTITFLTDVDNDQLRDTVTIRSDVIGDAGFNANQPRLLVVTQITGGAATTRYIGADITGVAFQYFDSGAIVPLVPAQLAVSQAVRNSIRSVGVTINGRSASVIRDTAAFLTTSYTFRVAPRNMNLI